MNCLARRHGLFSIYYEYTYIAAGTRRGVIQKKKKNVNDKKQLDSLMKELRCSAVH